MISKYRLLLRSIEYAFQGDRTAISLARKQLRNEFISNKIDEQHTLEKRLRDIEDIDTMLRFHIVQGKRKDDGKFEVSLTPEHHVTIEAGQSLQHGPELEPIDPSYIGMPVTISQTKADGKKFDFTDAI